MRPRTFEELAACHDVHPELTTPLRNICQHSDFPHLLVSGPHGSGKHTRVGCLLSELFGPQQLTSQVLKLTKPGGNNKLEVRINTCEHYMFFRPCEAGVHDRTVTREVIKETARRVRLTDTLTVGSARGFRVVVILEADNLTYEAQQALRRTMEKYATTCRLILCCESASKLIEPLRSRCLHLRVPAPSDGDVGEVLARMCQREGLHHVTDDTLQHLVSTANGNMQIALLDLEAYSLQTSSPASPQTVVSQIAPLRPSWQHFVRQLAAKILAPTSADAAPARLLEFRGALNDLIVNCVPVLLILRELVAALQEEIERACHVGTAETLSDDVAAELLFYVSSWGAVFEKRLHQGTRWIFHLEAFIARVMNCATKLRAIQ